MMEEMEPFEPPRICKTRSQAQHARVAVALVWFTASFTPLWARAMPDALHVQSDHSNDQEVFKLSKPKDKYSKPLTDDRWQTAIAKSQSVKASDQPHDTNGTEAADEFYYRVPMTQKKEWVPKRGDFGSGAVNYPLRSKRRSTGRI